VRQFADVHVRIARHHRETFPAAEPLQREQIAVLSVVPRGPSVPTTVRREAFDASPFARGCERLLDPVARRRVVFVIA
jgi:hypothetical protein